MSTDLPSELHVKAWMNPPEHRIRADAKAEEAFAYMKRVGIRHLLVMMGDDLVGVVTDRDLRRPDMGEGEVLSIHDLYRIGDDLKVEDVMTDEVITISPDEGTARAAKLMVENKFNCLPVVTEEKVVGILTSSDLLAALVYEVDPDYVAAREAEAS